MEDFSTYTEVDAGGKITVAENRLTAANLLRNENAYVYKDYGTDHFDALNTNFEFYCAAASVVAGITGMGFTVSAVGNSYAWGTSDVGVHSYAETTLRLVRGNYVAYDASVALTVDTLYYCTLSRTAGSDTITCKIYDSARTSLVDTLSVAGYGTGTKYRYLYGIASHNDTQTERWDGYFQNLDTGEGGGFFF